MLRLTRETVWRSGRRGLRDDQVYVKNLHPFTTPDCIMAHPVFEGATDVKLIAKERFQKQKKVVISQTAIVDFKTAEQKENCILMSGLFLGNSNLPATMLPFGAYDGRCPDPSTMFAQVYPHGPLDQVLVNNLPEDTTWEDVQALEIPGLVEADIMSNRHKFISMPQDMMKNFFGFFYFENGMLAQEFIRKNYELKDQKMVKKRVLDSDPIVGVESKEWKEAKERQRTFHSERKNTGQQKRGRKPKDEKTDPEENKPLADDEPAMTM